jgi:hypothetical protein
VATNLSITGKPAQFGRGMISDVGGKIIEQFAACLSDKLAAPVPVAVAEPEPGSVGEPAPEPEPLDLMRYARGSALQRIGPVVAVVAVVALVVLAVALLRRLRSRD